MHRQGLAGQGDRVLRLQWNHGSAELDARGTSTHLRDHRQRVIVVGHLRHPRGVEARALSPLDILEELLHLAGHIAPPLGTDHHAETHRSPPHLF